MKYDDFEYFEYFSPNENWGKIDCVRWEHVYFLNLIRSKLDWKFNVNCSYETKGHSKKSFHKMGMATDGYFKTDKNILEQYTIINKVLEESNLINFMGVGVYPDWNTPGFHFDNRGFKIHWVRIKDEYIYNNVYEILKKYYNKE